MSKKKILVVIDCQNDFISGSLRNEDAIKTVPNIANKIKDNHWDFIFLTRDTHYENYLETSEGKKLPVPHCIKGSEGWNIESSVMEAVIDSKVPYAIYNKNTFGLHSIADDLEYELNENTDVNLVEDVFEIEVCGYCSDICVISNVMLLKANFFNCADIIVDSNACAGVTPEKHNAALEVMKSCQIDVI